MDMNNVKSIYDNSVGKEVKKIQDGNGNILWYKVPDGYRKVEWLGTDGYAYIDTGIKPTRRDKHEAVFDCELNTSTKNVLFGSTLGAWNASTNNWILFRPQQNTSGLINLWYRTGASSYTGNRIAAFIPGTKQNLYIEQINNTTVAIKMNGRIDSTFATQDREIDENQPNYYLLGYYGNNVSTSHINTMKIYSYKLSQNSILVRHFIPVVRNTDEKPGMYDLVNDVFYTNAGTGEFTWGEL